MFPLFSSSLGLNLWEWYHPHSSRLSSFVNPPWKCPQKPVEVRFTNLLGYFSSLSSLKLQLTCVLTLRNWFSALSPLVKRCNLPGVWAVCPLLSNSVAPFSRFSTWSFERQSSSVWSRQSRSNFGRRKARSVYAACTPFRRRSFSLTSSWMPPISTRTCWMSTWLPSRPGATSCVASSPESFAPPWR